MAGLKLKVYSTGRANTDLPERAGLLDDYKCEGECKVDIDYPTISLCMIVRDESAHLERCLSSIYKYVDEIIVVDTGSKDNTIDIAKKYNAKIYEHAWEEDFSKARNQSIGHATSDWIIILDADEEIDKEDVKNLKDIVRSAHTSTANLLYTIVHNKGENTSNLSIINSGRIFRNGVGARYENIIHNNLIIEGDTRLTGIKIYHYGYNQGKEAMARKHERTTGLLLKQLKQKPDDPDTCHYLAIQYHAVNDFDAAIKYSQKAIELYTKKEPDSQLLILSNFVCATAYWHKGNIQKAWEYAMASIKIYPDFLDALCLLSTIYFATKQYYQCYTTSMKYFAVLKMLEADNTTALVVPINTQKSEWVINVQLAINFYEQSDLEKSKLFLSRAEECMSAEKRYLPSFSMIKYWFERNDKTSKQHAEKFFKWGYRYSERDK